jgi:hypothetical protein
VVLGDEDLAAFEALEAALMAELAPQGALQAVLARRIVAATWRLERAERLEAELFAHNMGDTASFGLALVRDCNRARAFDTLLRYRGTTLAELWRSLRTLKALQAEAVDHAAAHQEAAATPRERGAEMRNEPKTHRIAGESAPAPVPAVMPFAAAGESAPASAPPTSPGAARPDALQPPCGRTTVPQRIEPKGRTNPGESAPPTPRGTERAGAVLQVQA